MPKSEMGQIDGVKKYLIEIEGNSPIVWNVMKKELIDEIKKLKKDELSEWENDKKNWERKAEFDKDGKVIIPDRWFKNALITACKRGKFVPHFATRKNETYTFYVQSFMVLNHGKPLCDKSDLESYGCFVGAQGKNSSTKVWRVRPIKESWKATFEVIDPLGRMKAEELREIVSYAGLLVGIGDNRINNFGRFDVTNIKEVTK